MKRILLAIAIFISVQASAQIAPAVKGTTYGDVTEQTGAITVEQMVAKLAIDKNFTGKVQGKVCSVCTSEGCWMKLTQPGGDDVMVKMKGHSFFVPKDILNKEVVLQGTAKMTTTSVEMLKHYAEDAGKSKKEINKIKEPKREIEFVADGVLVL